MILPKRTDINKAKSDERKRDIDQGLIIARQVDGLRETLGEMQIRQVKFLEKSKEEASKIIDKLDSEIQTKRRELVEINERREQLLKPLDNEWNKVNTLKEQTDNESNQLFLDKESFKVETTRIKVELEKIKSIVQRVKSNEKETEKAKQEALNYRKMSQREFELKQNERAESSIELGNKIKQVEQQDKEYKVALNTIQLREQQVNLKEKDLVERELALIDKYKTLERTINRITK